MRINLRSARTYNAVRRKKIYILFRFCFAVPFGVSFDTHSSARKLINSDTLKATLKMNLHAKRINAAHVSAVLFTHMVFGTHNKTGIISHVAFMHPSSLISTAEIS